MLDLALAELERVKAPIAHRDNYAKDVSVVIQDEWQYRP
jgi:hypothetical protein